MTTTASGRRQTTACNGVTTAFPVNFQFEANGELFVYLGTSSSFDADNDVLLTEGVDYTVSGSGPAKTAVVNTTSAYTTGHVLTRFRVTSRAQTADFVAGVPPGAENLERALDRLALIEEEQDEEIDEIGGRALLVPHGETAPAVASLTAAEGKVLAIVGGEVTPIANNSAAIAADVLAVHNDRLAADAVAGVAAAALAAVSPYALANVLRRLAVLEDEIRSVLPALTTASAAYHAIYGTSRLVSSYSGPAFRAIRNSDGVAVDVNFTGKTVSPGDIAVLRGSGSVLRIDKWYDQSGNGRDMTQTVAGRRPGVHESAYYNGAPVILFDGGVNFIGGPGGKGFDFTHAMTGRSCAYFAATDFKASIQTQFLLNYTGASGGYRVVYHTYTSNSSIVEDNSNGPISTWVDKQFRAGMAVYGFREKAAAPIDLIIDGVPYAAKTAADNVSPASTPTAETLTTGTIGYSASAPFANYMANMRMTAFVAISGAAPNDADCLAVSRSLQTNYAIPTRFDSRVVIIGDSIAEGGANTNTLELMWYLRQQAIDGLAEPFNFGISGKTMASCYSDRLLFDAKLYKAGDPVVYVIQAGSNDLNGGVTATALYATLTSYVTYLKALGSNVKVIVSTIMKRQDYSAAKETQRVAYNALVQANAVGADAIWDPDGTLAAVDANYVNNNTILGDTTGTLIHPSSYGYSLLAPGLATKLNAVLP